MGCEYNYEKLTADNPKEAVEEVRRMIKQAAYNYGHAGYTGTFAEADDAIVKDAGSLQSEDAEDYTAQNCEKWGPAVVVKATDGSYHVGAHCSS